MRGAGTSGRSSYSLPYSGQGGGEFGQSPAMMLLSWQLAASIDFSPFTKITTRPSFAEAYLGATRRSTKAAAWARRFCLSTGGGSWHQRIEGSTRHSSSARSADTLQRGSVHCTHTLGDVSDGPPRRGGGGCSPEPPWCLWSARCSRRCQRNVTGGCHSFVRGPSQWCYLSPVGHFEIIREVSLIFSSVKQNRMDHYF